MRLRQPALQMEYLLGPFLNRQGAQAVMGNGHKGDAIDVLESLWQHGANEGNWAGVQCSGKCRMINIANAKVGKDALRSRGSLEGMPIWNMAFSRSARGE